MATIGNTVPTLVDVTKRLAPDGSLDTIVEILDQSNEVVQDLPMVEGNMLTGHRTTLRTSLPTVYYRRYNEGVLPSKSGTAQVDEVCAMMEAWSEIDYDLLHLNGMSESWRASEERPFVEAMGIQFASDLFYGNMATDPKKFTGLATRFNDLNLGESSSAAKDGAVVDGGGSGSDNFSIWLIGWGTNTVHGIYPQGSKAGLQREDMGVLPTKDANGGLYKVARTHFKWDCGIAVRDWRYVIRIANLDYSNLVANSSAADLPSLMITALNRRPISAGGANWRFYAPRPAFTFFQKQAITKASSQITLNTIGGRETTEFMGVPMRRVDQLLNSETALT
jgi:hypothetical protein